MNKLILKLLIVMIIASLALLSFTGCKSPDTAELEERIETSHMRQFDDTAGISDQV